MGVYGSLMTHWSGKSWTGSEKRPRVASRGRQRPAEAEFFFWLKWFLLTPVSIPDGPWWCPAPPEPSSGLEAIKGRLRPNFFFVLNGSFWTQHSSLVVPDGVWPPPGPSSGLEAIKGRPRPKFFLAQTVPFDHSIDPWWSLMVSGLPRTLQRPQGLQRLAKTKFFWGGRDHYTHEIYNVPLEPERAAEARKARRSCEL